MLPENRVIEALTFCLNVWQQLSLLLNTIKRFGTSFGIWKDKSALPDESSHPEPMPEPPQQQQQQ